MREYILYVILVFLPIGAVMAYLLQKEGVSRKNIAIVVAISWLIVVSFPLSIAKIGTFIALMTYIVAILLMTRYLLGTRKEFIVESKGTLVTGVELQQLLVNMEKQGYDISDLQDSEYVSLGDDTALNNLIARQARELGAAQQTELVEIENNERQLEDIIRETADDDLKKPEALDDLQVDGDEIIPESIDKMHEHVAEEAQTDDDVELPSGGEELLIKEIPVESEITGMPDDDINTLPEAVDIPADIAAEKLESEISKALSSEEDVIKEAELLEELGIKIPGSEELTPEELVRGSAEEQTDKSRVELLGKEEENMADTSSDARDEELVIEVPEIESTVMPEPGQESLPPESEDLVAASVDAFELNVGYETEAVADEAIFAESAADISEEVEQAEAIAGDIKEDISIPAEEPKELPEAIDIQAIDEPIEVEPEEIEIVEAVLAEADEIPVIEDLEASSAEAALLTELIPTKAEDSVAASFDFGEADNKIESDHNIAGSEETVSESLKEVEQAEAIAEDISIPAEEPKELPEAIDIQAIDEPIEAEPEEIEMVEAVLAEADKIPAIEELEASSTEAELLAELIPAIAEEDLAAAGLEIIDGIENDNTQSSGVKVELADALEPIMVDEPAFKAEEPGKVESAEKSMEAEEPPASLETAELDKAEEEQEPTEELRKVEETLAIEVPEEAVLEAKEPGKVESAEKSMEAEEPSASPETAEMDKAEEEQEPTEELWEVEETLAIEVPEEAVPEAKEPGKAESAEKSMEAEEPPASPETAEMDKAEEEQEPIEELQEVEETLAIEVLEEAVPEAEEPGKAESAEKSMEAEEPPASLETAELDKAEEEQEPTEELREVEETFAIELAEEAVPEAEDAAELEQVEVGESGPSAGQLFELIDRGFALKEMGSWQEAGQCFMDADALTEDVELKELLNVEIVNIFRLIS